MERIRFATAQDVFESFETAAEDVGVASTAEPPLDFLNRILSEKQQLAALSFCAYLLPRRECVWWACQSVRYIQKSAIDAANEEALLAAESWVREPGEARRKLALRVAMNMKSHGPGHLCALAAAWSGGPMFLDESNPVMAEPHLTARSARGAVLTAIVRHPAGEHLEWMRIVAVSGSQFAAGKALVFNAG
jgi:hypothetical protein